MPTPKKRVGRQLNDGIDVVVVDQIFANSLSSSVTVELSGELDNGHRAFIRQLRKHVHRKGKVGFVHGRLRLDILLKIALFRRMAYVLTNSSR